MVMMMMISFSSLIVSVIYIHFGLYALNQNKSGLIHKLFFSVAITSAYWSFCTAVFHFVQNKDIAINIYLVSLLGPFFLPAIVTHTILAISYKDILLKNRWLPHILYLPSCISVIGLFIPGMIIQDLIFTPLGWMIDLNKSSFFVWFYISFATFINLINIIILYRWKIASTTIKKKNQALIILFSFLLSIISIYTEEIFCMFIKIQSFPSLSHIVTLIWLIGVLFVIKKYRFIMISPEKAVHEILFNMMDILLLTDEKGEITRVNQQLTQLLGCSEKDLVNKPAAQLFEDGLNLSTVKTLTQCRKNIMTKKEESIPVLLRISPLKSSDQEIVGFLLIGHDDRERMKLENEISERQNIEKRLIESRSQYISTINAMDEMIHVVDSDLKIILCNNTFSIVARGFDTDFTIGLAVLPQLFPFLRDEVYKEYREVFDTGKQVITEEQNEIGEEVFYTETRKIPVFKNHRVVFIVTIIRDVTEKKKIEQSQLCSGIADSVSMLAGGIAHDYNNILTTILGNITLAKTYYIHKAIHHEALAEAELAGLQARDLTQQLLTFSQKGTLVKESGDIGKLLRKSASFFLSGSNIKCEVIIPDNLYNTRFNKQQIARVFQNILLNAKQAMPNGGVLSIMAQNKIIDDQRENYLSPGKYIEISFIDQGEGIRADILSQIFNPYFTTKESGSGLGLATAYSITKKHGGVIEVFSKIGEGTTFTVSLPADEKQDEPKVIKGPVKLKKGKGTILIMDDDKNVRDTLKRLLEHLGYSVTDVDNGNHAIALYNSARNSGKKFDLVILDYTIPGGESGGDVFQNLYKCDPCVKALIISGYGNNKNFSRLMDMGLKGVVKKPFDIEELSVLLEKIISSGDTVGTINDR